MRKIDPSDEVSRSNLLVDSCFSNRGAVLKGGSILITRRPIRRCGILNGFSARMTSSNRVSFLDGSTTLEIVSVADQWRVIQFSLTLRFNDGLPSERTSEPISFFTNPDDADRTLYERSHDLQKPFQMKRASRSAWD